MPSPFTREEAGVREATALSRMVRCGQVGAQSCCGTLPCSGPHPSPVHTQAWLTQPVYAGRQAPAPSLADGGFLHPHPPIVGTELGLEIGVSRAFCVPVTSTGRSSELGSQADADWDALSPLGSSKCPQASISLPLWCPRHLYLEKHFPGVSLEPRDTDGNQQRLLFLSRVLSQALSLQMCIQGIGRLSEFPKNKAKEMTVSQAGILRRPSAPTRCWHRALCLLSQLQSLGAGKGATIGDKSLE